MTSNMNTLWFKERGGLLTELIMICSNILTIRVKICVTKIRRTRAVPLFRMWSNRRRRQSGIADGDVRCLLGGQGKQSYRDALLKPNLAPYKAAVFPLVKNKPEITVAREVFHMLAKRMGTSWDDRGNIWQALFLPGWNRNCLLRYGRLPGRLKTTRLRCANVTAWSRSA